MNGVMLELANVDSSAVGGVISIDSNSPVAKLVNSNMSPTLGWIALVAAVALFAAVSLSRSARRRSQGLSAPPVGITIFTIAVTALGGIAVVVVCNLNRGALAPLRGVPWVVPFVLLILVAWTWLLGRTRLGRYIYAIGANPEGARRAGINVARVRTAGFALCSMTAGIAGLVYESRLGSMSTSVQGGNLVLYAVAAAVIGGTSLFGGRGRPLHALLGGIIIATVFNGLGLMGVTDAVQFISTAIVLIAAVTLDSVVRRRAGPGAR
jgi:D-xylose transport system permease protein